MSRITFFLALAIVFFLPCQSFSDQTLFYPRAESNLDNRTNYPLKLLKAALKDKYVLKPSQFPMNQGRALIQLERDAEVDVVWSGTSNSREKALRPIRIPIYKGAIGLRLLLIHNSNSDLLKGVESLEDLKIFRSIQGGTWPEVNIFKSNGLQVKTSHIYESMFHMLERGRVDYFPRSIIEIWDEQEKHQNLGIIVDSHIALRYPHVFYFFVNKNNEKLYRDISKGLNTLIENGKFDELFWDHHSTYFRNSELHTKRIIDIYNPELPPNTPLNNPNLWLTKTPKFE